MVAAKFQITRKCRICGNSFIAKTISSWYCSPKCSKIAYKRRIDEEKKKKELAEIAQQIPADKEYIKVSEAYAMFEISHDVLYRQVRKGAIPFINMGQKQIRVSKTELAKLYPLRKDPLANDKPEPKMCSLKPKNQPMEHLPRWAIPLKTLWMWILWFLHTRSGVLSTKLMPVHLPSSTFLINKANGIATSCSNSTKRLYETTCGNRWRMFLQTASR